MMNFSARWSKRASIVEQFFVPAQNGVVTGVVEGPMHYGAGNPSFQMTRDTQQHGTVETTPQRPKKLAVSSDSPKLSPLSDFVSKNDLGDVDDGSLPCTPELDSEIDLSVGCSAAGDEVLEHDTRHLIGGFLVDFVSASQPRRKQSEAHSTMQRVVEDVIEKHRYLYNGMLNKLELDERGDDMSFMSSVAKSLFSDGNTNWGRIASLVAFGAVVCQYLKKDREQCVRLVGHEISTYLLNDQREWLIKNNSWDGFVDFFRVADPESTVRNTLMAVAGFAGIGATLALLIR